MKYLQKSFSVPVQVDVSQEEWDAIFRPKKEKEGADKGRGRPVEKSGKK